MHPLDIPTLETKRLVVRRLTRADLESVVGIRRSNDESPEHQESIRRRTAEWLDWTVQSYDRRLDLDQPPYGERGVIERADSSLIGLVGLVPSFDAFGCLPSYGGKRSGRRSPEVGLYWMIHRARQRNGFATEAATALIRHAFDHLLASRLIATTEHGNAASISVMRKLGMRIERNPDRAAAHPQTVGILEAPDAIRPA